MYVVVVDKVQKIKKIFSVRRDACETTHPFSVLLPRLSNPIFNGASALNLKFRVNSQVDATALVQHAGQLKLVLRAIAILFHKTTRLVILDHNYIMLVSAIL